MQFSDSYFEDQNCHFITVTNDRNQILYLYLRSAVCNPTTVHTLIGWSLAFRAGAVVTADIRTVQP